MGPIRVLLVPLVAAMVLRSSVPYALFANGQQKAGGVARTSLRSDSELSSNCFDFPANNFDRIRSVKGRYGQSPNLVLETGQGAIDFTLHNYPGGEAWTLRDHLGDGAAAGKPVVLIWGMFTCPAFQGMGDTPPLPPWDMCGYSDEYDLVEAFKDRVTFVHLYGPEPHPTLPATNFDQGVPVNNYWSTVTQPTSYSERLAMVDRILKLLHPDQVVLPDYLPDNPYSDLVQPVWCSYGYGARPATAISPNGTIFFQQEWLHTGEMTHQLEAFLAR